MSLSKCQDRNGSLVPPFQARIMAVIDELLKDATLLLLGREFSSDRMIVDCCRQDAQDGSERADSWALPLRWPVMLATFAGAVSCPASGCTGVVLAGMTGTSFGSKSALIASGVSLLLASTAVGEKQKHAPTPYLHRLVGFACLYSGVTDILLLAGVPTGVVSSCACPLVSMHIIRDLLAMPLFLLSIGYLSGRGACSKEVLPLVVLQLRSVAAFAGAAAVSSTAVAWSFLLGGTLCFIPVALELTQNYPIYAMRVAPVNCEQVQEISESLVLGFGVRPLMQALYLIGFLDEIELLMALAAADALTKTAVGHMMLRNRLALWSAGEYQDRLENQPHVSARQARLGPQNEC